MQPTKKAARLISNVKWPGTWPRAIIHNPRHDDRLFSDPDITNKATDQTGP